MTTCLGLTVMKGYIHFCVGILVDKESYEMIELWRMDEDGDWNKAITYNGPMSFFLRDQSLLHLMSNGNLLIQHVDSLYALDMKKHTKDMVFNTRQNMDRLYPYKIPPRGKYIETTVSPNRYMMCRGVGKKPELKLDRYNDTDPFNYRFSAVVGIV
ncbi:hypothetical protein L2E82_44574 [Cichorium intybus]|uniref:Uncharacterized protein n=1 Tax=Cichorium intybus TaxID=13427 RepID=A0ACB8ZQH5_CICIN|nr:hypothetical protein L2E82_44574 [Cichorium intybus]